MQFGVTEKLRNQSEFEPLKKNINLLPESHTHENSFFRPQE